MKKALSSLLIVAGATGLLAGCATASGGGETQPQVYVGHFQPMNTAVTGTATEGAAKLIVRGDTMTAIIKVHGAPPNITHWQHFHGFKDGSEASCPSASADANGDRIVDLIETHPASGKTMLPFISDPTSMDVAHGSYPQASADGFYSYRVTVPMDKLTSAFSEAFGTDLNLDRRVIYIHGVPESTALPASVASLGPIPAQVTLPIACAELHRVK